MPHAQADAPSKRRRRHGRRGRQTAAAAAAGSYESEDRGGMRQDSELAALRLLEMLAHCVDLVDRSAAR
jgi:hypothetical protein